MKSGKSVCIFARLRSRRAGKFVFFIIVTAQESAISIAGDFVVLGLR